MSLQSSSSSAATSAAALGSSVTWAAAKSHQSSKSGFYTRSLSTVSFPNSYLLRSAFVSQHSHILLQRTRTWSGGTEGAQLGHPRASYDPRLSRGSVTAAQRPYTAVMIVPTGTGASIGGFAGDSLPVARAMASVTDCLVTHPNVLNGAMLYWPMPNTLYVEGYALDKFAEGSWGLQPVHQNRVEKWVDSSGASTGRLGRPDSLMRAVSNLVENGGVDAVAVVARFPDDCCEDLVDYRQGKGVDVLAGVEAIISHMVVKEFQITCAHAPALALLPFDESIAPRSTAEEIGFTFLPCVLVGLSRAPQYISKVESLGGSNSAAMWGSDVDCVVVPINACGGAGTLAFAKNTRRKPLILAVEENETVLDDTREKFQLDAMRVANYWEALGVMAAHKAGVDPRALRRNAVGHLRQSNTSLPSRNVIPISTLESLYQK